MILPILKTLVGNLNIDNTKKHPKNWHGSYCWIKNHKLMLWLKLLQIFGLTAFKISLTSRYFYTLMCRYIIKVLVLCILICCLHFVYVFIKIHSDYEIENLFMKYREAYCPMINKEISTRIKIAYLERIIWYGKCMSTYAINYLLNTYGLAQITKQID